MIRLTVFLLLLSTSAFASESMASHESHTGNAPSASHGEKAYGSQSPVGQDNGMTDADYEAIQEAIDNDVVDTSVDGSTAPDDFTPPDVTDY